MPLPFLKFFVSVDEKNGCRTSNNQIALNIVQGDREGAGQVALDGERRGGVAQVRDGAEGEARRAR